MPAVSYHSNPTLCIQPNSFTTGFINKWQIVFLFIYYILTITWFITFLGIGTKHARLHVDAFVNMLGEDEHSWGLSHKGLVWHKGIWRQFTKPFRENEATSIGLLFDGIKGTLTYYRDGINLGVAFTDLHLVKDELYPIICSTAAKTEMSLGIARREFISLQDRCRTVILNHTRKEGDIRKLNLPNPIKMYLIEEADHIRIVENSCKCASDTIYCVPNGIKKYLIV